MRYFLLIFLAACAASPKKAMEPEGPAPSTIEEAEADLSRARMALEGPPAPSQPAPTQTSPQGGVVQPSTPPPPMAPESPARLESRETSACETPCRAIASMRRAVTTICRLAGEEDARCTSAREVLKTNEKRVSTCGC
jgi:hypothetical protein